MPDELKLAFVGDVMCGDSFSLMGKGAATMIDRYGEAFLPDTIIEVLRSHDMVMGNIECVLSDVGRKENSLRRLHMRGRPETAKLFSKWGITVANLANNHILEQGQAAAVDTAKNLNDAGIGVIGAGAGNLMGRGIESLTVELKGLRIGLLGICLRKETYAYDGGVELPEAIEAVRTCKNSHDLVILSVHWGQELIDYPSIEQRDLAKRFQQAGVDLIIGHHPHVIQGFDRIDSALVAYSLGNFIFDGFSEQTGWSAILSVTVKQDRSLTYDTVPLIRDKEFRPQLAGTQTAVLQAEIQRRVGLRYQTRKYMTRNIEKKWPNCAKIAEKDYGRTWQNVFSRLDLFSGFNCFYGRFSVGWEPGND
jgi:poly-gamma-glutamate synthesis protein (capsule biosynthesis protein)